MHILRLLSAEKHNNDALFRIEPGFIIDSVGNSIRSYYPNCPVLFVRTSIYELI